MTPLKGSITAATAASATTSQRVLFRFARAFGLALSALCATKPKAQKTALPALLDRFSDGESQRAAATGDGTGDFAVRFSVHRLTARRVRGTFERFAARAAPVWVSADAAEIEDGRQASTPASYRSKTHRLGGNAVRSLTTG